MIGFAMRWRSALLAVVLAVLAGGCQSVASPGGFSAEQRAALQAQGFVDTGDGWELSMADSLLFASNSAELEPAMVSTLNRLATNLTRVGIRSARVDGHTDSTGSTAHNANLSHARAAAVARLLTAQGFAVEVAGRGETAPVAANDTEEGRALNRRVVIIVSPE